MSRPGVGALLAGSLALGLGCAVEPDGMEDLAAETGLGSPAGVVPDEARESTGGPRVAAGVASEVWAVRNAWTDTDTAEARLAGVAWGASSGLTWEAKYERWVASFRRVPRSDGSGTTVELPTPYGGRVARAPTLECAEVAMFLRATFASWYHLPFYLQGWDSTSRQVFYAGHFGFVTRTGQTLARFPAFKTRYADHEARWRPGMPWPSDASLRRMHLGTDDAVPYLPAVGGSPAGAGAWFDELLLNKRTGYFLRLLLLYFGSVNLADGNNMYHVRPEAISAGDVLLERWQRQGIGHTIPVVRVSQPMPGRFAVDVVSGSMPRRQPVWDDPSSSRHYFTLDATGGEGNAWDGVPYARLGGGLRRWRTAVFSDGQWSNVVLPADREAYLEDTNLTAIAARPARFGEVLVQLSASERRRVALERVATARAHLRAHPASCSARTSREDAMAELYEVEALEGRDRAAVDAQHRLLEDYVFAELDYPRSRTCCWNTTTAAMGELILDFARVEQERARARGQCVAPTAFRASGMGDGYDVWRAHAMTVGRAAEWRAWSEDEPCSGRASTNDPTTDRGGAAWCSLPRR
ncbi:MAG: hypothetical protein HY909_13535 [Deltaproteobacteria bacterium]|nr:hypothetical protein [Deltaproteobacteria bacterium]